MTQQDSCGAINLLFVTPAFYPATYWGGPIYSTYGLCNSLAQTGGAKLRVLTTDTAGPELHQRVERAAFPVRPPPGYDVYYCRKTIGIDFSLEMFRHLVSMVRWADVVHLTAVYSSPTIPTLLACRLLGRPLVWSPRGALQRWVGSSRPRTKRLWEYLCNALLVKGQSTLHVTSEDEGRESAALIPRAGVACVPNGVELPTLPASRLWKPGGRLRLLYIGRLDVKKGIENLLAALIMLTDTETELSICGNGDAGYEDKLHQLVKELALDERVRFRGFVEGTEKSQAFFEADLCVVPSFTENFAMVVAEALAHGVPVIASKGTPWAEVERRGCGLWVNNDAESLTLAIQRMNKADLHEMGNRGRLWMEKEFSWDEMALRMAAVYQRLGRG